ncbi:MerR family transcriptional regulator [Microbacterium foliorum]|uniref:MerR family transcriptional regulator n=1 Tax=Microbacterium foliorum TaxID=104336 RepID=UPI001D413ADD|nr:MerR family transcriptional regulator [Microbacterium foliorum]CAH0161939.1 Mercuric resistance operon regulatory protein [Microbacterium foliorum]CAH0186391.1 Mercuric resistance operon regulatory protein [Microbacterium foliorum]
MTWSTKQLADLAAVSLRTIRHYHGVGLLPEPERLPNGYKQYDTAHLVTVLRIKRMSSLGLSLEQIAEMLENPGSGEDQLRTLDSELTDTISRLERVRAEVRRALDTGADPDITPEALAAMSALGRDERGRNLAILVTDLRLPAHLSNVFDAITESPGEFTALNEAFTKLDPDASDAETQQMAIEITEAVTGFLTARPALLNAVPTGSEVVTSEAVMGAMRPDTNPAQGRTLNLVTQQLKSHFGGVAESPPHST